MRISIIGDSVLELYTISEEKDLVIARMQSNGWSLIDFKPEEIPEFNSKKMKKIRKVHSLIDWHIFTQELILLI